MSLEKAIADLNEAVKANTAAVQALLAGKAISPVASKPPAEKAQTEKKTETPPAVEKTEEPKITYDSVKVKFLNYIKMCGNSTKAVALLKTIDPALEALKLAKTDQYGKIDVALDKAIAEATAGGASLV